MSDQAIFYGVVVQSKFDGSSVQTCNTTFCLLAASADEARGAAIRLAELKRSPSDGWKIGWSASHVVPQDLLDALRFRTPVKNVVT